MLKFIIGSLGALTMTTMSLFYENRLANKAYIYKRDTQQG